VNRTSVFLLVIALVALALLAIVPRPYLFEHSVDIQAPVETVRANLVDFGRWSLWFDPAVHPSSGGPPSGVGARSVVDLGGILSRRTITQVTDSSVSIEFEASSIQKVRKEVFSLAPSGEATHVTLAWSGKMAPAMALLMASVEGAFMSHVLDGLKRSSEARAAAPEAAGAAAVSLPDDARARRPAFDGLCAAGHGDGALAAFSRTVTDEQLGRYADYWRETLPRHPIEAFLTPGGSIGMDASLSEMGADETTLAAHGLGRETACGLLGFIEDYYFALGRATLLDRRKGGSPGSAVERTLLNPEFAAVRARYLASYGPRAVALLDRNAPRFLPFFAPKPKSFEPPTEDQLGRYLACLRPGISVNVLPPPPPYPIADRACMEKNGLGDSPLWRLMPYYREKARGPAAKVRKQWTANYGAPTVELLEKHWPEVRGLFEHE
jgi:hypothetical protein